MNLPPELCFEEVEDLREVSGRRSSWFVDGEDNLTLLDEEVVEALREMALAASDRIVGLEQADVTVDGCITKAPCGGEKAGRSPVNKGKRGIERSTAVDERGIPLGVPLRPTFTTRRCCPRNP